MFVGFFFLFEWEEGGGVLFIADIIRNSVTVWYLWAMVTSNEPNEMDIDTDTDTKTGAGKNRTDYWFIFGVSSSFYPYNAFFWFIFFTNTNSNRFDFDILENMLSI